MHSEHNRESVQTHMLQIWITPHAPGGAPSYQEGALDRKATRGAFQLVASPDEGAGAVRIGQDVRVWAGCFDGVERAELQIADGRRVYVHAARGESYINGQPLGAGDALMSTGANRITVQAGRESELLVFDLP
jgi:redox-sensitive bicupin YhaK (pirin superfamily)